VGHEQSGISWRIHGQIGSRVESDERIIETFHCHVVDVSSRLAINMTSFHASMN
jgi:hypothetical protein